MRPRSRLKTWIAAGRAQLGELQRLAPHAQHVARTLVARELAAVLLRHLPERPHPHEQAVLAELRERANRVRLADLVQKGAELWDRAGRPAFNTLGGFVRFLSEAEILLSAEQASLSARTPHQR